MRLNRGTGIFFLILVVVIAAAYFVTKSNITLTAEPTSTALTKQALFPSLVTTDVTSLTVSAEVALEDTRPTPLPSAEPLPTLTPVPEGEAAPTQTDIFSVMKDAGGNWVLADNSTMTADSPVVVSNIESALKSISTAQAESFVPDGGDYAQYGLDKPSFEVTFVVVSGSTSASATGATPTQSEPVTHRLRIGDRSLDNLSYYAFLDDDSQTVYIISSASSFQSNVLNLATNPPFAPTPTPIPTVSVTVPGTVFTGFSSTITSRFSMTDNATGESLVLSKASNGVDWTIENADPTRTVSQPGITSAFQDVASVQAVSRASIDDLSTVGLDNPAYTMQADFIDGTSVELSLGEKDPTGSLYYTKISNTPDVILVNAVEIDRLLALITNPPYEVEATPELTAEATQEMTAEATEMMSAEATQEVTAEATEMMSAEATEVVPAEATESMSSESQSVGEATQEMTVEATQVMTAEATETSD